MSFGTKSDRDVKAFKNRLRGVLKSRLRETLKNEPVISERKAVVRIPQRATTLPSPVAPLPDIPPRRVTGRPQPAGKSRPGDLIAQTPRQTEGAGGGARGGNQAGDHMIEIWMDEDDLWQLIQEEWKLPDLFPRRTGDVPQEDPTWDQRGTLGPPSRLLKRRTMVEATKHGGVIHNEDRRYRRPRYEPAPVAQAVVYLVRDVSGSMMNEQITVWIRTMAFVLTLWLQRQYPQVAIEFITYEMHAQRVPETEFFGKTAGGGTQVGSALTLIQDLQDTQYPPADWQQYAYIWTDGMDFSPEVLRPWLDQHASRFTQMGWVYTQLPTYSGMSMNSSTEIFRELAAWVDTYGEDVIRIVSLHSDEGVGACLQSLFSPRAVTSGNAN